MPGSLAPPRNSPPAVDASLEADHAGLAPLLASRRVLLCVGCGGVGKTTTTAALGLAAARRGKRVLCLTIDPRAGSPRASGSRR